LSWWHATYPETVTLYIRCLAPESFRNTAAYVDPRKTIGRPTHWNQYTCSNPQS